MADKKSTSPIVPPHRRENFRGYTIGELRQQRLLTQIRMELLKEKLLNDTTSLRKTAIMPKGTGLFSLADTGLKLMSYADFFGIGFALFRSGRKLVNFFRKNKK